MAKTPLAKAASADLHDFKSQQNPPSKAPLDDGITLLERLLKASADQLRLQILQVLQHDSFGVLELCALFDIKQSAMSHHLKVLFNADLVTTRREGNAIFYRRSLPGSGSTSQFVSPLFATIDAQPLAASLQTAIDRTQRNRSEQSLKFFNENSERFKAQQDLIVDIHDYRDTVDEILDTLIADPSCQRDTKQAIEIGPGDGFYLANLSRRYDHVIALDNAEPMLKRCQQTVQRIGLGQPNTLNSQGKASYGKVAFILGDTSTFIKLDTEIAALSLPSSSQTASASKAKSKVSTAGARKADCVVANMVLHHNAKPQAIIEDVAQLLAPNGVFVISELCQHDQDWVRGAAGDVWLGFSEALLDHWASEAKLIKGPSSYTALRNGFSIQILSYIKSQQAI